MPVLTVPGNHDVADPETLARFRERYGRDYGATTWRHCEFLLVNSMLISTDARHGYGYRVFCVAEDSIRHQFIQTEPSTR